MSRRMLACYYWLPTNGRLSFCTVESGSSSRDDLAINPVNSSLARATTRPMVRTCAWPVWQEHQQTLSIVLTLFVNLPYHSWLVVHVHIKRSAVTMVYRRKMFGKIISHFSSHGAHTIRCIFKFIWSINCVFMFSFTSIHLFPFISANLFFNWSLSLISIGTLKLST